MNLDWSGMIMGRGCMMELWEDGGVWIRWQVNFLIGVHMFTVIIIRLLWLTLMEGQAKL